MGGGALRVLLDTHALLWWLTGDTRLSDHVRRIVEDDMNEVFVSAASAWEICTKFRLGKLPNASEVALNVAGCLTSQGFRPLDIEVADAQRAGLLESHHRDPFDRMIAAQAIARDLPVASIDVALELLGARRIW